MNRQYNNRGRDQLNFEYVDGNVIVQNSESALSEDEQRSLLLQRVQNEVESDLADSSHYGISLNVDKESQPEQVWRPRKIGSKPPTLLAKNTTILQVFDSPEITGRLLILGDPGSGKTTELRVLAQALVERAKVDRSFPIPVLFNLSTWKDDRQSIQAWLVHSLSEHPKHKKLDRKLAKQWVKKCRILPLLDGLDELAAERQVSCVNRINEYLDGASAPLYAVVCSGRKEYELHQKKLKLNGSICLKKLRDEQIASYLTDVKRPELWQAISAHPNLLTLLRTPFFLSITVLAYPLGSDQKWQQFQTTNDHQKYLLNTYIERMLERQLESRVYGTQKVPEPEQTRQWLVWLARQMQQQSQTEFFLIEEMQPSILSRQAQLRYRQCIGLIYGLTAGLIFEQGIGLVVGQTFGPKFGLKYGLMSGLIFGLLFGLMGYESFQIKPVEALKWSWSRFLGRELVFSVILALVGGLTAGLIVGLKYGLMLGLLAFAVSGLMLGLFALLVSGLMLGLSPKSINIKSRPNQGIKRSARNSVIVGLIGELILGDLISGAGLIVGLMFGGLACIQHCLLRLFLWQAKQIPWNYARFLDYCRERMFIQQVGGRYRFMHKLLQDHFAAIDPP